MTRGIDRRIAITAVAAVLFLFMGLLAPTGTLAAQPTAATPIPPGSQLPTNDDGDVGAAAIDEAWFDSGSYTYDAPIPLTITLNISMAGIVTGGTFSIPTPAPFFWENPAVTASNPAASCNATMAQDGTLSGTFSNPDIAPATCQISFDVASNGVYSGPTVISAAVDWNNGQNANATATLSNGVGGFATSSFDQDTYTAVIEDDFDITFTFTMQDPAFFGGASIPHPAMLAPYTNIRVATNDPLERTNLCTAVLTNGEIDFDFDLTGADLPRPFTCTITFTTSILPTAGDGESASISVRTYIAPGFSGGTASASIVGYLPSTSTMTLDLSDITALPGQQLKARITHVHSSGTQSNGTLQLNIPDGATYDPDRADSIVCGPVDCDSIAISTAGDSVVMTYSNATQGETIFLDVDFRTDDDAVPGTLTFSANGEVGDGSAAQRTGPATATLTITSPPIPDLATTTLAVSANPGETITGTLAGQVSGGVPPYTFSLLAQATQGSATVNADGTFSYTANADATGTDSFTYQVTDSAQQATDVAAAAAVDGTVDVSLGAVPETPTPTATLEPTSSPTLEVTPSPTSETTPPDGSTPAATVDPGQPPVRPTQTSTPVPGSQGDSGSDDSTTPGEVTTLPSTGTGSDSHGSMTLVLLAGMVLLLAGSLWTVKRTRRV